MAKTGDCKLATDNRLPRVYRYVGRAVAPHVADLDDLVAEIYLKTFA